MTERSPWRIAHEGLLSVLAARSSAASETVTLKQNAKGDVQPEVTATAREGESLMACYARAAEVMREALREFGTALDCGAAEARAEALEAALRGLMAALAVDTEGNLTGDFGQWSDAWLVAGAALAGREEQQ